MSSAVDAFQLLMPRGTAPRPPSPRYGRTTPRATTPRCMSPRASTPRRRGHFPGNDLAGSAELPPSSLGWAVAWRPKSASPRKPVAPFGIAGFDSPGPKYAPANKWLGKGPHGLGAEYSVRPNTWRADKSARRAQHGAAAGGGPGPKYMLPGAFGKQVTSLCASYNAGKFTNSKDGTRTTTSWLVPDSPGPSLNVRRPFSASNTPLKNGMGGSPRFYASRADDTPGPGDYVLHPTVGASGRAAFSIGRGERSGTKHLPTYGKDSPGPIYRMVPAVGEQVSSRMSNCARVPFNKASRGLGISGRVGHRAVSPTAPRASLLQRVSAPTAEAAD